ncbi:hypothetical protein P4H66_08815 [Paenibacillus dokdonensis]|uniref:SLH domain-containing protein n=1 Tax=Paenibacillus dokdonensis TaxID=2567944 RepID=A0ABU6GJM3_9BACL|nr:hypothetical protein [Paenibacillus dokdonensis]MEC0239946.1 hypothetical protein [Paenibacillus dokdonensis]
MQTKDGRFDPRGTVSEAELVQITAKVLLLDVKSVNSWAEHFNV